MDDNYILQAAVNNLLYLFDHMPAVPVRVKYDDYFLTHPHVLAFYDPTTKKITVKPDYLREAQMPDVIDTLKHEMIHAWLHRKGIDKFGEFLDDGHNEWFVKKALEIGVDVQYLLTSPEAVNIYNRVARIYDPFATIVDVRSRRWPSCGSSPAESLPEWTASSNTVTRKPKPAPVPSRWHSIYASAVDNTTTLVLAGVWIALLVGPAVGLLWLTSWLGVWK